MKDQTPPESGSDSIQTTNTPLLSYEPTLPMTATGKVLTRTPTPITRISSMRQARICRICLEGEDDAKDLEAGSRRLRIKRPFHTKNPLIHPCKCSGTMAYVHLDCLNRWRDEAPKRDAYYKCGTCGYEYSISRPRWASIFASPSLLHTLATFFCIILILGFSYLCKAVDVKLLHNEPDPANKKWYQLHGVTVLWLDRIYLLAGVIIVAVLGLTYLIWRCLICEFGTTLDCQTCCCCYGSGNYNSSANSDCDCNCDCCSDGNCDCSGCNCDCGGGDCGECGVVVLVILGVLLVAFGLFGIFAAVYACISRAVERVLASIKEQIQNVSM
ncbi:hypothetical protein BC937DRAFT_95672 [Endogone sp. FLAS-F59071]|nr:hypothetical protein BC937DRAFT_95672 [Endogone sp. FLAS-F59071]|eukprot:RUS13207.1 hypothetical protein BC937DRAFT_95672 [Endogone sp. FLAS-F59071]